MDFKELTEQEKFLKKLYQGQYRNIISSDAICNLSETYERSSSIADRGRSVYEIFKGPSWDYSCGCGENNRKR